MVHAPILIADGQLSSVPFHTCLNYKHLWRRVIINVCTSSCKVSTSFVRLEPKSAYVEVFSEIPNIKFNENTSGESRALPYRPTNNEDMS